MIVLPCAQPVFCDVDDTLVMWGMAKKGDPEAVAIKCPSSRYVRALNEMGIETDELVKETGEWTEYLVPHKRHIAQLVQHKLRGHTVIVWSAGGWEWAEAVVRSLGIEKYVDLVIEKPMWYYDDRPAEAFMGKPIYMKDVPIEPYDKKEELSENTKTKSEQEST